MSNKVNGIFKKPQMQVPTDITIKVTLKDGVMSYNIHPPQVDAVVITGVAMGLLQESTTKMAMALRGIIDRKDKPNRTEPHAYVVNESSEKSVRLFACGLCGESNAHIIHEFNEPTEIPIDGTEDGGSDNPGVN